MATSGHVWSGNMSSEVSIDSTVAGQNGFFGGAGGGGIWPSVDVTFYVNCYIFMRNTVYGGPI